MKTHNFISLSLFAVILVCFFLPFVTITCGDMTIAKLKGTDLAFGTTINVDSFSNRSRNIDPEILALLPFILSAAGLILSIIYLVSNPKKPQTSYIILCILSSIIFVSLLALQFKLNSDISSAGGELQGSLKLKYEPGYWLSLILSLIAAVFNLYLISIKNHNHLPEKIIC